MCAKNNNAATRPPPPGDPTVQPHRSTVRVIVRRCGTLIAHIVRSYMDACFLTQLYIPDHP
ncbi:hypothetical protein ACVKN3_003502 [Luteibacter sp. PvP120]